MGIQIAQLFLSLSILIVLHEGGHYWAARWFKIRVEKFYLFFDAGFALFKKKIGETEYGIGWLPLGGYVKIAGMMDESMDKEQMNAPAQPWEFRSKPTWQRLIVMIGGVTVNLILAILIFSCLKYKYGEAYLPPQNAKYGIAVTDSLGYELGLKDGDMIESIGAAPLEDIEDFNKILILEQPESFKVKRNGEVLELKIPKDFVNKVVKKQAPLMTIRFPAMADTVLKGGAADKAGLLKNDQPLTVNGQPAFYFNEIVTQLNENKGKKIDLKVLRGNDTIGLNPVVTSEGKIGFGPQSLDKIFELKTIKYNFITAIPAGTRATFETISNQLEHFALLIAGKLKAKDSLGGFGSIAKIFPNQWDWYAFWKLTATLSAILAFMNILPIPALDGGHVLFLIYEMIFRRAPNEKFLIYAQVAGMVFLLGFTLYVNGLDVLRAEWFKELFAK